MPYHKERKENEAPRSKLQGIKAELRRSQPAFPSSVAGYCGGRALLQLRRGSPRHLCRAKALATADHPCSKLQGILAKANKKDELFGIWRDHKDIQNIDEYVRNLRKGRP
ncbi:MAG: hypothetical protein JRI72_03705 [Deltaproteobacteria bacterium]|nr:hypothetical protein [Deltaproteobacteria bacterium]